MTTLMNERLRRYSGDDIRRIAREEEISDEDVTFLTALSNFASVIEVPGTKEPKLANLRTVDIPVIQVSTVPTGIYREQGKQIVILINEDSTILDYDLISDLHPMHEWDVYLWLDRPWLEIDSDLGVYGEWYRRDVYPDGMSPYKDELGWEDRAPVSEED